MTRDERQDLVIKNWIKARCRGILIATVGFGKTRCAMKIINKLQNAKPETVVEILCPTTALVKQWQKQIKENDLILHKSNVKVRTLKSLLKQTTDCDLLIIDELHTALSINLLKAISQSKFKLFLGLTATINRLDENEKYIMDVFPIFDEVTKEEALSNNWVAKDVIYKVEIKTDLSEYFLINEEYTHHFSSLGFDFHLVNKILNEGFRSSFVNSLSERLRMDKTEIMAHATNTMRLINLRKQWLYNHPLKVYYTDEIIKHRLDKKIITFSESQQIANSLPYGDVVHSGMTSKKQRELISKFSEMDIGVLHSVKSLQSGIDVRNLSVGISTSFNSSKIARIQSAGRIERAEGDKQSEFFNLVIKNTIEEKWFAKAMAGIDFITINEDQLKDILNNKEIIVKKNKDVDLSYLI